MWWEEFRTLIRWLLVGQAWGLALGSKVQSAYLVEKLCPRIEDIVIFQRKPSDLEQAKIAKELNKKSPRELAREYGVSHEIMRRKQI